MRKSLPHICAVQQSAILRALGKLYGFMNELEGALSMAARIDALTELFVYLGILNHALEHPNPSHYYVVALLFGQSVSRCGPCFGEIEVPIVKV